MNDFHCAAGHSHEVLPRKSVVQQGIVLGGEQQERRQQAPAAGDAGYGKAKTIGSSEGAGVDASSAPAGKVESETRSSSQGGAVDAFSAPAGRAESETTGSSQGGAVDTSSAPVGRAESETSGSSHGGAVDASSIQAGRAESDLSAASTSGTDQGNGEYPPSILSGRAAHELNDRGRLPVIVRGRTRVQSQRLEGGQPLEQQQIMNPEVADALLVAAYEWAKSGSILKSTSWTTQDAMAMMAGRPVENKRELNACMTSGFQIYVSIYCTECRYHLRQINIGNEPPPQSAADATGPGV